MWQHPQIVPEKLCVYQKKKKLPPLPPPPFSSPLLFIWLQIYSLTVLNLLIY